VSAALPQYLLLPRPGLYPIPRMCLGLLLSWPFPALSRLCALPNRGHLADQLSSSPPLVLAFPTPNPTIPVCLCLSSAVPITKRKRGIRRRRRTSDGGGILADKGPKVYGGNGKWKKEMDGKEKNGRGGKFWLREGSAWMDGWSADF
jgi:hypothetical protein